MKLKIKKYKKGNGKVVELKLTANGVQRLPPFMPLSIGLVQRKLGNHFIGDAVACLFVYDLLENRRIEHRR